MAEAAVERTPAPTRYFCHMCNVEINIPNTDFTCPLCAGGFVEEMPSLQSDSSAGNNSTASPAVAGGAGRGQNAQRLTDLDHIRGEIATLLMSRNAPNVEISFDPRRANMFTVLGGAGRGNTGNGSGNNVSVGGGPSSSGGGRGRPPHFDRWDNVLLDFLQSLSGGDGLAPFANSQMFYMGNLGDYAWGREGIDTIVTQLLNQMETSGPPPLSKNKIAEIPKVEVTDEEVNNKLQCSVCWEDFKLKESVRKLPCSHIYHEECIVPWLDLHGTCPICRKVLSEENKDNNMETNEGNPGTNSNSFCPFHRTGPNGGANSTNTGGNSASATNPNESSTNTSQTQNQRNNVFSFEDINEDLD